MWLDVDDGLGDPPSGGFSHTAASHANLPSWEGAVQASKSVDFVAALPLSPLGKPDKKARRARYAAR